MEENIWEDSLAIIKDRINPPQYKMWFEPIKPVYVDDYSILFEVPSKFYLDWIKKNYLPFIEEVLFSITSRKYTVKLKKSDHSKKFKPEEKLQNNNNKYPRSNNGNFSQRYTFDSFVVGSCNQFPHAATLAVAKSPGEAYNPLFLYGGVGLGKTHLLHAIGNYVLNNHKNNNIKICYTTSEKFTFEFIQSTRNRKMDDFRKRYRNMDFLLIDDVQFWSGKEGTQEEFFHLFNTLYELQKQIVLTSDRFPKEITDLDERLRSRFEMGLIADLQLPDLETRVAIIKKKSETGNTKIPDDVAFYLASKIESNIRELEGLLIRVGAYASLNGLEITLDMTKEVVKNILPDSLNNVSIDKIIKEVAKFFSIKVSDIKSKNRHKNIAYPRQISMYLARKILKLSFPDIALSFGGKHHTSVIYAVKSIEKMISVDPSYKNTIEKIRNNII